jgi:hypothetical protein
LIINVQYVVDDSGKKNSVLIPSSIWKKMNHENERLQNKISVLTGIKKGILEVKNFKKSGKACGLYRIF